MIIETNEKKVVWQSMWRQKVQGSHLLLLRTLQHFYFRKVNIRNRAEMF